MSLRDINREMSGKKSIWDLLGLRRSHFSKLHQEPSDKPKKNLIVIIVIAAIVVGVIGVEVVLWSNQQAPPRATAAGEQYTIQPDSS